MSNEVVPAVAIPFLAFVLIVVVVAILIKKHGRGYPYRD